MKSYLSCLLGFHDWHIYKSQTVRLDAHGDLMGTYLTLYVMAAISGSASGALYIDKGLSTAPIVSAIIFLGSLFIAFILYCITGTVTGIRYDEDKICLDCAKVCLDCSKHELRQKEAEEREQEKKRLQQEIKEKRQLRAQMLEATFKKQRLEKLDQWLEK